MYGFGPFRIPGLFTFVIVLSAIDGWDRIEKHLNVQPASFAYQFTVGYTVVFPHSCDDCKGAVVFVGFVWFIPFRKMIVVKKKSGSMLLYRYLSIVDTLEVVIWFRMYLRKKNRRNRLRNIMIDAIRVTTSASAPWRRTTPN